MRNSGEGVLMTRVQFRMTLEFCADHELERLKLGELHHSIVDQVKRLGFSGYFKVTMEYEGTDPEKRQEELADPTEDCPKGQGHNMAALLSDRQLQIASMLCNHYSIKRIAGELYVSVNTVKKHMQNMKKALCIDSSGADFIYELKRMMQTGGTADSEYTSIG